MGATMRGYLKASGVIHQCIRCYALRDLSIAPGECPSCRKLLNVSSTVTRPLAFADVSTDINQTVEVPVYIAKAATA
jgi:hypothetical protein